VLNNIYDKIDCLDKGFVKLVDYMGNDAAIVQAARVSYGNGTKTINEDRGLIRYLLRHKHTTPLEMVVFKFHVKAPIFVARQWIRHRMSSTNEYSGRYSEMMDEFYIPNLERLTKQSSLNKQGSSQEQINNPGFVKENIELHSNSSYDLYSELLNENELSRELSRMVLPINNYTEWYWKIDLHNLLHFLRLRVDLHAQYEIRVFADAISDIISEIVPIAYEAYEDYILNGVNFSKYEYDIIKDIIYSYKTKDDLLALISSNSKISKGEVKEFINKIYGS
jgi:thymidylate synthase (FAD)